MTGAFGIGIAYLAGAFPTAYLAGRIRGVDLASAGSGNYGATNVYRNLGAGPAVVVLIVDILKGFAPVRLLSGFSESIEPGLYAVLLGLSAVVGHVYSVFLRFRGGKGIGTAGGAFLALAPVAAGVALMTWIVVVAVGRIVSVASLAAATVLMITVWALEAPQWPDTWPLVVATAALTVFVFYTHRDNIRRLRRGEEARIRAGGGS